MFIGTLFNPFLIDISCQIQEIFIQKKSNAAKIFCAWCQQWKTGHIVLTFTKGANWKIHKHSKGEKLCKGSDKIVMKKKDS